MPDQNGLQSAGSVERFDRTYHEVMDLLEAARNYARAGGADPERERLNGPDRLVFTCESMRVTSRLTQCMAWLMMQRAIDAGELPPEAAALPENRISGESVCGHPGHEDDPLMPRRLRELLQSSRGLYERLSRIEERVAAQYMN